MSLMVAKGNDTKIDPPKIGAHHAVCCEVYDRGIMKTDFGPKRKVWLVFRVNEIIEGTDSEFDGKYKEVRVNCNLALGPRTTLRKHLESWRGEPLSDDDFDENGQFDLLKLEGVQATLVVGSWSDPDDNDRQWANDINILPPEDSTVQLSGSNEMDTTDYLPIDERKKRATDFPPPDEPGNKGSGQKSSSKGGKKPAPF